MMKASTTNTRLPRALGALALLTIGVGLYMAFLRPPLLPEDLRALGVDGKSLPPSLLRWLSIVFTTWGAFIMGFGVSLLGVARAISTGRMDVLRWATALGICIAFGRFLWSNIVLHSDFLGFIAPLCAFAMTIAVLLILDQRSRLVGSVNSNSPDSSHEPKATTSRT